MLRMGLNRWCRFSLYWLSVGAVLRVPVLLLLVLKVCLRVKHVVWRVGEAGPLVH